MLLSNIFHLQWTPYSDKNLKLLHFLRQFVSALSLLVFLFAAERKIIFDRSEYVCGASIWHEVTTWSVTKCKHTYCHVTYFKKLKHKYYLTRHCNTLYIYNNVTLFQECIWHTRNWSFLQSRYISRRFNSRRSTLCKFSTILIL